MQTGEGPENKIKQTDAHDNSRIAKTVKTFFFKIPICIILIAMTKHKKRSEEEEPSRAHSVTARTGMVAGPVNSASVTPCLRSDLISQTILQLGTNCPYMWGYVTARGRLIQI